MGSYKGSFKGPFKGIYRGFYKGKGFRAWRFMGSYEWGYNYGNYTYNPY